MEGLLIWSPEVTDEQWATIEPYLPGKKIDPGRTAGDNRSFINNEFGQPAKLQLTEAERHNVTCAEILLDGAELNYVIADKAYDRDAVQERIRDAGTEPIIPTRSNHLKRRLDRRRYKLQNVVE
jgi:transposase